MKLMDILREIDDDLIQKYKFILNDTLKKWNIHFNNIFEIDIKFYNKSGVVGEFEYMSIFEDKIVIFLNLSEIENESVDTSEISYGIEMTIFHELFHALVALDDNFEFKTGTNIIPYNEDEERHVEDAAYDLQFHNKVDDHWFELVDHYKTHKHELGKYFKPMHDYGYNPFEDD